MLTKEDIITSSGSYPERAKSPELTDDVKLNMDELMERVNKLLNYLNIKSVKVSSGFRPQAVNAQVKNAAKMSAHQSGQAVDLLDDKDQTLCKLITKELLERFDLYREDSDFTKGKYTNWCHLQTRKTASGNRIFKP